MNQIYSQNRENENRCAMGNCGVKEKFEVNDVCNALKYNVTIFGRTLNLWVVLCIVLLLCLGVYMYLHRKNSSMMTSSVLSDTSSDVVAALQQGGFMLNTPTFIRRLA